MLVRNALFLFIFKMPCYGYLVMWDLGDTLIAVSKASMVMHIGLGNCAWYHMRHTKEKDQLQNLLFDVLEEYGGGQKGEKHEMSYHTGHRPLPQIMCDWLAGKIKDPKRLVRKIHKKIDLLHEENYFKNNLEYKIVKNAIASMFDPEILVKCTYVLKEALEIIEEIAQKGVHQQTILSNLDHISFEVLKNSSAGHELSRYFNMDSIVISGLVDCIKPHPDIFDICLERYNLPAEQILLIDDQKENVAGARRNGFMGIQIKNHDFKQLRKELEEIGIL